ncbi:hypothetical protein TVAG_472500 [Trichomonas vaginalis G3]|uniref:Right handed beta helix domain-containing protein n=1 Tax=Trichomonas vaginalis (strain ATCC PRA-98 / G3) TaxID=412133 RepID=A2G6N7_TRIV3|nr:pectin lyase-like family [Trichomonas vaginalis G3]EAX87180.1 hypothetical protein TVAG_472500 [Trichomonas vaginalis G3]KAI5543896.1 pectin lyase-like family [Trichomonas vaginalis G3]|eukprot:XP_001300110.1 hypothetical protein [Trichomonas vaginalis G3]
MLTLFLSLSLSKEIYAKVNGLNNSFCHLLAPCDFINAANQVAKGDYIHISGSSIEEADDLDKIRVLFNVALGRGAIVTSNNMTINGTNYRENGVSFIVIQSAAESRLHKFHFTGFKTSIMCFRKIDQGVISMCIFSHNYVVGSIAMLMFGVGKCKLDECYLAENTVTNTSLIAMFSTHLYLNMTIIERNFVKHDSPQSLLYSINSVCEYTNTTIRNNASPYAPLHQFEFRSCFGFWNCTWENNHHQELLLCDGTCEFNFSNNSVQYNQGTFISTSAGSVVTFNESDFRNNFSGEKAMFDIPGSKFIVYSTADFRSNTGRAFIDTRGLKSDIQIQKAKFSENRFDESVILTDSNSTIDIYQTTFSENMANLGTIHANQSSVKIHHSQFTKNHGTAINVTDSISSIDANHFTSPLGPSITSNRGTTNVISNFFRGQVIGGHLNINGKHRLYGLKFTASDSFALSSKLRKDCFMCSYKERKDTIFSWAEIVGPKLLIIVLIIFFYFLFQTKLHNYVRIFFLKKDL